MAQKTAVDIRRQLFDLDPYKLEHLVANVWSAQGWETEVHQESGDAGVDVVAWRTEPKRETQVIQVKRYSKDNKVGGPEIQQYRGLIEEVPGATGVTIVTTGTFTDHALARAYKSDTDIELINGTEFAQLVLKHDMADQMGTASTNTQTTTKDTARTLPTIPVPSPGMLFVLTVGAFLLGGFSLFEGRGLSVRMGSYLLAGAWFVSPVTVFLDANSLHQSGRAKPNRLIWPFAYLLFFGSPMLVYVYFRQRALSAS